MTAKAPLLLSTRYSEESIALWREAIMADMPVRRLSPREVSTFPVDVPIGAVHGELLFVEALRAARPDLLLAELPSTWLTSLLEELLGRKIWVEKLSEARKRLRRNRALFVKPTLDKQFEARVYSSDDLAPFVDGDPDVIVSDPVRFTFEARAFYLPGEGVVTMSPYIDHESSHERGETASEFAVRAVVNELARLGHLPVPTVVDVGKLHEGWQWVVVEANPAWGSGIYRCDPAKVLRVLEEAVGLQPSNRLEARPFR